MTAPRPDPTLHRREFSPPAPLPAYRAPFAPTYLHTSASSINVCLSSGIRPDVLRLKHSPVSYPGKPTLHSSLGLTQFVSHNTFNLSSQEVGLRLCPHLPQVCGPGYHAQSIAPNDRVPCRRRCRPRMAPHAR